MVEAATSGTGSGWTGAEKGATGLLPGREVAGPLGLIVFTLLLSPIMTYTNFAMEGSFVAFFTKLATEEGFAAVVASYFTPFNPVAWRYVLGYMAFELALMRLVPGKPFHATVTKTGHVPVYTANGVQCYVITIAALFAAVHYGVIDALEIYQLFGPIMSSVTLFALVFCLFLYFKGLYFPSTRDCGSNGNFIIDYFWGTELYPRVLGWDVKVFTNCRFGMMWWQCAMFVYAIAQYQLYGYVSSSMLVSAALQTVYIAKFFWWETGYFNSMDIQHDRAGYYICWGCLCYLPVVYTSQTYYMVQHPVQLSPAVALAVFVAGVASIYLNYDVDRQRQLFRASNGKMKIWGKDAEYIVAKYTTADGTQRTSLLLCSGYFRLASHFTYVFEILASFFWSIPTGIQHFMPMFYVVYLTILLVDRAFRDQARCQTKYGEYWTKYEQVTGGWKIIPGLL